MDAEIYKINKADLYFYLDADFPFVQDGTRMEESERNRLDGYHRQALADFGVRYRELSGDWAERVRGAAEQLGAAFLMKPIKKSSESTQ